MENAKCKKIAVFALLLVVLCTLPLNSKAEDTTSPLYKITGATFGSGGDETQSSDGLRIMPSIGSDISGERFDSPLYSLGGGSNNIWEANVPIISCFETTSNGSTSCTDPVVVPNGMVMLCGYGGCYNKGRFEIDNQSNPTDTLYSIQVTTDPAWTLGTWSYLSSAFTLKSYALHNINDYQTESYWESTVNFNITGLESGKTYYLRATALHGDFTESGVSPTVNTTTAYPSVTFDLDVAENDVETTSPYQLSLGTLKTSAVSTSDDLIWIDVGTNADGGVDVRVSDLNNGLFSPITGENISSSDENLDISFPGFGLVQSSVTQEFLGPLTIAPSFGNGGNIVGGLSTTPTIIYTSNSNPIYNGRGSFFVKARSGVNVSAGIGYQDQIIFRVIGSY